MSTVNNSDNGHIYHFWKRLQIFPHDEQKSYKKMLIRHFRIHMTYCMREML